MGRKSFTAFLAAALVALTILTLAMPAEAGRRGYGRHHHGGNGWNAVGAGLLGFGVGAIVGSALTPREVYVAPPPPRPTYYTPAGYGPPPWTPDWYTYCYSRYRSFDPNSGTFIGYDGYEHFCR